MKAIPLLMWKSLKVDIRRPKGLCCEMTFPILVFALFALLRSVIDKDEVDVNYGDEDKQFVSYDYEFLKQTPNTTNSNQGGGGVKPNPYQDIARLICPSSFSFSNVKNPFYPASYFSIVPDPTKNGNGKIKYIVDQMRAQWQKSKDDFNQTQAQLLANGDECTFREFPSCTPKCDYFFLNFTEGSILKYFDNNNELENYLDTEEYASTWDPTKPDNKGRRPVQFAIVFDQYDDWDSISYTLRGNASIFPDTDGGEFGVSVDIFNKDYDTLKDQGFSQYMYQGLVAMQLWINQIITEKVAAEHGVQVPDIQYGIFTMPTAGYLTDDFYGLISTFLPFLMILVFIYPYFVIAGAIVEEKASKIKEGLRMMGASLTSYWCAVYFYYGIKFFIIALLCTVIAYVSNVFEFSDFSIILIWFTLFMYTLMTSAIMLSVFFDNPRTASMVSSIFLLTLYFISAAARSFNQEEQKTWLCLSGPACFAMSTNNFGKYEEGLIGLQWDNLGDSFQYLRFRTVLIMMLVDCIIYTILALYLDRVIPSRYGQRLPFYFPFQSSFWCPNKKGTRQGFNQVENNNEVSYLQSPKYEKVDTEGGKVATIQIRRLRKEFSSGFNSTPFVAVNDISMDMYENEIFCLLGHNGAGKTTTIGMLSGMLNITSGKATINGQDIVTNMAAIRESLGVCPQHDVLWSKLTVAEHLALFASLKGVHSSKIQEEVDKMIAAVKMEDKRDKFPTQLSGGQKRKLSLGNALIGGSKIVFLDEPTSGMDPHSRRDAWQLIKDNSKGRTIILTTHFMDEADILSDRIAIMNHGQIVCCGSSLFLKKLYGVGYSFTISLNTSADYSMSDSQVNIANVVRDEIPSAAPVSTHGAEIIYRLPFDESKRFPTLFRKIDQQKEALHIDSYGISVTTLEEVFLRVGQGHQDTQLDIRPSEKKRFTKKMQQRKLIPSKLFTEDEQAQIDEKKLALDDINEIGEDAENVERIPLEHRRSNLMEDQWENFLDEIRERSQKNLFFIHVMAMLYKKFHIAKRDKRALLCQFVLPLIFMMIGFILVDLDISTSYPKLELNYDMFEQDSNLIPVNKQAFGSSNKLATIWNNASVRLDQEFEADFLELNGGNNGWAYEYEVNKTTMVDGTTYHESLRTFADSLLKVSDASTQKYAAFYFPTESDDLDGKDVRHKYHIGIGTNVSVYHGLPLSVNMASNIALKAIKPSASITARLQPLPATKQETENGAQVQAIIYATYLSFGFAFFPVGLMYNIVHEKETLVKHQQLVSGLNSIAYWVGTYLFDMVTILPSCAVAIILVEAFDAEKFLGKALGAFILILVFYGTSITSFTYVFSWCFQTSQRAQYVSLICFLFLGYGFGVATFVMDIIESTRDINNDYIKPILRFSPSYLSTSALLNLATREFSFADLWRPGADPLHWEITGMAICYMGWQSILYLIITLIIEYVSTLSSFATWLGSFVQDEKEDIKLDEDVEAEQNKIKAMMNDETGEFDFEKCSDPIIISGLRKVYYTESALSLMKSKGKPRDDCRVAAVKDLYYTVPRGQVFGFLGQNGAGKTSSISMLCGKFAPTNGQAWINQTPITDQIACRRMIGYCPQFDAVFDLLTSREHMVVYGMIKGLNKAQIEKQGDDLIESLLLTDYADKRAGTYSGGNKRKLSVAIAMIGQPPIVFLDEPSTGMDPVSRRCMWDFISSTMFGRSVILTTHSMEECEALCHRIGIMVKGQLRCIGTSQWLKSKFGEGYQLDANLEQDKHDELTDKLRQAFGGEDNVQILESQSENIKFRILGTDDLSLADMFEKLEIINDQLDIKGGYALNQTTLEQIFIQIASQNDDK